MRKQMLQGLRYKLSAEVLHDGLSGEASSRVYRVVWRVPQPQGRPPLELSASAEGTSHEEAQKQAWESLYLQAAGRKSLQASVVQATQEQRNRAVRQQLEDAAQQRRESLQAGMSILSSEAAAELAVRHNAIIQRLRIQALDEVMTHEAGQHCTLQWEWQDPSGEQRRAVSVGLGTTKRQAKGEAIRSMLAQQSIGSALDPVALNAAGNVRSLARSGGGGWQRENRGFGRSLPGLVASGLLEPLPAGCLAALLGAEGPGRSGKARGGSEGQPRRAGFAAQALGVPSGCRSSRGLWQHGRGGPEALGWRLPGCVPLRVCSAQGLLRALPDADGPGEGGSQSGHDR